MLVENLLSEPTAPEHLITILDQGHLDGIGVCLDLGHAHISVGVTEAISVLNQRIVSMHVHDNHGTKDEHLWPGEGTIDWAATREAVQGLKNGWAAVLEIAHSVGDVASAIPERVQKSYERLM